MFRIFLALVTIILMSSDICLSGKLSQVDVKTQGDDTLLLFKGEYGAYRVLGASKPARLIMEFFDTTLSEVLPRKFTVESQVIRGLETLPYKNGTRVVIYAVDPNRLFKYKLSEVEGELTVICSKPAMKDTTPKAGTLKPLSLYTGQKITMDFYKTDIHNVMRLFGEITGMNIVLDEKVKGEVTISLKDVPWDQALDMILEANGLTKEEKDGVIAVRTIAGEGPEREGALIVKPLTSKVMGMYQAQSIEKSQEARIASLLYQARALDEAGEGVKALELYEKAFSLMKPYRQMLTQNYWVLQRLFEIALRNQLPEKAYHYSKEALLIKDRDQWATYVAALSSALIGRDAEARVYFQMAVEGQVTQPDVLINYAIFLERQRDTDSAIDVYKRYEQEFGPDQHSGMEMARLYLESGQKGPACQKYKEVLRLRAFDEQAFKNMVAEKIKTVCEDGGQK